MSNQLLQTINDNNDKILRNKNILPPQLYELFDALMDELKVKKSQLSTSNFEISAIFKAKSLNQIITMFLPKKADVLSWRISPHLNTIKNTYDERVRYMFLPESQIIPLVSGLYIEIIINYQPYYVLCNPWASSAIIFTDNILTKEYVENIYNRESARFSVIINALDPKGEIARTFMDLDKYWVFVDHQYDYCVNSVYIEHRTSVVH